MKYIFKIVIALLVFVPSTTMAATSIPWFATSTTQGWIVPGSINGVVQIPVIPNLIATSTTATSTFAGNVLIGTTTSFGFNSGQPFEVVGSANLPFQMAIVNRNAGPQALACLILNNNISTNLTFSSQNYGGLCFAGSNYNTPGFNAVRPNGMAVFTSDGTLTIGSASTNAASSSVYFQAGSGFDASYDMVLAGGTGRLGIGTTSPFARLSVAGATVQTAAYAFAVSDQASTSLLVVQDTGRVGIGTTTPAGLLHVAGSTGDIYAQTSTGNNNGVSFIGRKSRGTTAVPADVIDGDATVGLAAQVYSGGTWFSGATITGSVDDTVTSGQRPASRLSFFTGGSGSSLQERIRIDSTGLVGIGTTTPTARLSVRSSGDTYLLLDSVSASNSSGIAFEAGTNNYFIRTNGSGLNFGTGTFAGSKTTRMILDSSGQLGIGTTTPQNTVDVYASNSNTTITTPGAPTVSITNSNTTNNNFSNLAGATINTAGSEINTSRISFIHEDHTSASEDGEISFMTRLNGTMGEVMRITNDAKVGIGTSSPLSTFALTVQSSNGSGVGSANFVNTNSAGVGGIGFTNDTGLVANGLGVAGTALGSPYSDDLIMYTDSSATSRAISLFARGSSAPIKFFTGGTTERARFTSAGNLGVGTSTPDNLLTTFSSSGNSFISTQTFGATSASGIGFARNRISATTPLYGGMIRMVSDVNSGEAKLDLLTNTNIGSLNASAATSTSRSGLRIVTSSAGQNGAYTEVLRLTGGVSSDQTGTLEPQLRFTSETSIGNEFSYGKIGALVTASTTGAMVGDLTFYSSTAGALNERMRITGAGNVGIGTTSPSYPMAVELNTSGQMIGWKRTSGATAGLYADLSTARIGTISNSDFGFYTNSSGAQMTLTTAGNLGIGTTTPSSSLDVYGSVSKRYRAITSTRTLDSTDYTVDATTGTFTVNLPTAAGIQGRIYVIKNSGTGVITIDASGSELIDGALTQTLSVQYTSYTIQSTGTGWIII